MKIISEHKKFRKGKHPKEGMKRVEAIVKVSGELFTRHIDVKK